MHSYDHTQNRCNTVRLLLQDLEAVMDPLVSQVCQVSRDVKGTKEIVICGAFLILIMVIIQNVSEDYRRTMLQERIPCIHSL